ncbi:MAG: ribonuclease P protein component [Angustibacter sp.]
MLPSVHRMRHREDFALTVRRGGRCSHQLLVAYGLRVPPLGQSAPARIGFVVAKTVGGAVVRTRVKRKLRAQAVPLLAELPADSLWVFRAQPASASASSQQLGEALSSAAARLRRRSFGG